jgi:tight adherence protein C
MSSLFAHLPIAAADIPAILAALAAGFAVLTAWSGLTVRGHRARARDLILRRAQLRDRMIANDRRGCLERAGGANGFVMAVVRRLRLFQGRKTADLRLTLARAGLRSREALASFLFAKLAGPPVLGVLALLLF